MLPHMLGLLSSETERRACETNYSLHSQARDLQCKLS